VFNSPTIREELAALCRNHTDDNGNLTPLPESVLIRPVPTRWNSVAEMLSRALMLQPVLTTLCERAQFNKRDGVRLRRFVLEDEEWALLRQLEPILGVRMIPLLNINVTNDLTAIFICNKANIAVFEASHPPSHTLH
jgi:hypothetical protein